MNEIVWVTVRQLLDMTDAFKKKLDKQNNISRHDNLLLTEKLAKLQQERKNVSQTDSQMWISLWQVSWIRKCIREEEQTLADLLKGLMLI